MKAAKAKARKLKYVIGTTLEDMGQAIITADKVTEKTFQKRSVDEDFLMAPGDMPFACYKGSDFKWSDKKLHKLCLEATKCWLC